MKNGTALWVQNGFQFIYWLLTLMAAWLTMRQLTVASQHHKRVRGHISLDQEKIQIQNSKHNFY